ncbi:uncharacterized protein BJ212DRAFT_1483821 [Suillus subaureus]|uniref:RRM domain-containing protein n=1 Tax=Suillus subaureus TaxID=48587 RepID=A0A9P7JAG2_9AGAM|nr:uncharacterized protein BJ212DRAFT_1483821 [Suillus subaureus]KAG1811158.1 hypothetical protein BJ212DRAFT_1483821 [Suillus subaureus]
MLSNLGRYGEPTAFSVDPYSDAYNAPAPATAHQKPETGTPPHHAIILRRSPPPEKPTCSNCMLHMFFSWFAKRLWGKEGSQSSSFGVFGLSIRTQERDLDEFPRFGRVEKSQLFTTRGAEEATRCIQQLNGVEPNGRRTRVDYSVTDRSPHQSLANIWDIVARLGTPIQAQVTTLTTVTHMVTAITVVPNAIRIGTPTVVTAMIGAIIAVLVVTHLITGARELLQESS